MGKTISDVGKSVNSYIRASENPIERKETLEELKNTLSDYEITNPAVFMRLMNNIAYQDGELQTSTENYVELNKLLMDDVRKEYDGEQSATAYIALLEDSINESVKELEDPNREVPSRPIVEDMLQKSEQLALFHCALGNQTITAEEVLKNIDVNDIELKNAMEDRAFSALGDYRLGEKFTSTMNDFATVLKEENPEQLKFSDIVSFGKDKNEAENSTDKLKESLSNLVNDYFGRGDDEKTIFNRAESSMNSIVVDKMLGISDDVYSKLQTEVSSTFREAMEKFVGKDAAREAELESKYPIMVEDTMKNGLSPWEKIENFANDVYTIYAPQAVEDVKHVANVISDKVSDVMCEIGLSSPEVEGMDKYLGMIKELPERISDKVSDLASNLNIDGISNMKEMLNESIQAHTQEQDNAEITNSIREMEEIDMER